MQCRKNEEKFKPRAMAIQKRKISLTWSSDYEPGSIYGSRFIDLNSPENESPLTKFSEEFH